MKETVGDRLVLIMFDRNYALLELVNFLEKRGVKYLIRLNKRNYKAERGLMKSADEEVALLHTKSRMRNLKRQAPELEERKSTDMRILKTVLPNGDEAAFMTNLREGTADDILRLYRKRWSAEVRERDWKGEYIRCAGFLGADDRLQHGSGLHNGGGAPRR